MTQFSIEKRKELLQQLGRMEISVDEANNSLNLFPWDWDGPPLFVLTEEALIAAITNFIDRNISATELENWADALEVREDVQLGVRDPTRVRQVIFELANPSLTKDIDLESAAKWIAQLADAT